MCENIGMRMVTRANQQKVAAAARPQAPVNHADELQFARKRIVSLLKESGSTDAVDLLSRVETALPASDLVVRRAFWQLLNEGVVGIDNATYSLTLLRPRAKV